jgi:hypothetical protein
MLCEVCQQTFKKGYMRLLQLRADSGTGHTLIFGDFENIPQWPQSELITPSIESK